MGLSHWWPREVLWSSGVGSRGGSGNVCASPLLMCAFKTFGGGCHHFFPFFFKELNIKLTNFWLHWVFIETHGSSCSEACGALVPGPGINPSPLHWKAGSQPLDQQGSPLSSPLPRVVRPSPLGLASCLAPSSPVSTQKPEPS